LATLGEAASAPDVSSGAWAGEAFGGVLATVLLACDGALFFFVDSDGFGCETTTGGSAVAAASAGDVDDWAEPAAENDVRAIKETDVANAKGKACRGKVRGMGNTPDSGSRVVRDHAVRMFAVRSNGTLKTMRQERWGGARDPTAGPARTGGTTTVG